MNVLILAAGQNSVGQGDEGYPVYLSEIGGHPLIEIQIKKWAALSSNFLIAILKADIQQFSLDKVLEQVSPQSKVIPIERPTAGAACTALLAAEQIDNNDELVILNGDELIDIDYAEPISFFRNHGLDAGTIIFDSIHPRYSFVSLDENELVTEAAEKKPISRNATAGFYWYRKGSEFVSAAMDCIRKQSTKETPFFIAPIFNEMILKQKKIGIYRIDKTVFKPFKSSHQLEQLKLNMEKFL